ncbi:uncharacterized protein LOC111403473 isoform X2 [Olea europaea var. sylvestris]|uniref:uncharacterized protein LOC111403473 isoform X2 n=1 Tax=Olea europaea var. sylvestris TaxID=158386 RepID=UPI000C1D1256|nr:uncharacterized protein LOC111403473 isoform X2 [Olea europaea var. sylvestris]
MGHSLGSGSEKDMILARTLNLAYIKGLIFGYHHPYEAMMMLMLHLNQSSDGRIFVPFEFFLISPKSHCNSLNLRMIIFSRKSENIPVEQPAVLRLCVAVRFLSVYPKDGAKSLLRSVSNRFEKSKRMDINVKDKRVDEERQQPDKEVIDNGSKEPNDDGDNEEDENEDDNLGEDMDADEPFDPVSLERNLSLQPRTYTDNENVSRDYLQDLFGSFPFGVDQQEETAGEYQIYEQYSDDNYSEDEDY